jgi:low affinity Fe/Cu permease
MSKKPAVRNPIAEHEEKYSRSERIADAVARIAGSTKTFFAAVLIVLWALTGPLFNFSDTWQLVINTGTTIVTFLMVFLIQNSQDRQSSKDRAKASADYDVDLRSIEDFQKILSQHDHIHKELRQAAKERQIP